MIIASAQKRANPTRERTETPIMRLRAPGDHRFGARSIVQAAVGALN
jgi:hypothetical protein